MIFEIPKKECCAATTFENQDTMLYYFIEMINIAYHLDTVDENIEFKDNDFFNIQSLLEIHSILYKPVVGFLFQMMCGSASKDTHDAFLHLMVFRAIEDFWDKELMPTDDEIEEVLSDDGCPPLSVVNEMRQRHDMETLQEYIRDNCILEESE